MNRRNFIVVSAGLTASVLIPPTHHYRDDFQIVDVTGCVGIYQLVGNVTGLKYNLEVRGNGAVVLWRQDGIDMELPMLYITKLYPGVKGVENKLSKSHQDFIKHDDHYQRSDRLIVKNGNKYAMCTWYLNYPSKIYCEKVLLS